MKAVMLMFDSLNRHMLPPYGCDWVRAPNFQRLAAHCCTFDKCFVGSMPCMPARRELHTGRYNFLHRSWGPLEPFDDSMPELLKRNRIPSHLVSDHYHYWEEGGANYHTKYSNWQISRGQEGDPWHSDIADPADYPMSNPERAVRSGAASVIRQDWINRSHMRSEDDLPQAKTMTMGIEYLERNHSCDNWFLQIETFDPHEPYFVPERFKQLYDYDYSRFNNDWPDYRTLNKEGDSELSKHYRMLNAALISMCDHHIGRVLDTMDRLGLWEDTMLIVNTDHGFLLGEHDWWAKCRMPFYNEIAHAPLFIWDPRTKIAGRRRRNLVQTIDLPATLLEFFGVELPPDMQGRPLRQTIADDSPVRAAGLFGLHGAHVNVTDGRHVYMRAPVSAENTPLFQYTHMPAHMKTPFSLDEMRTAVMAPPFPFTKGCPVMRIAANGRNGWAAAHDFGTMLFDIESDPKQANPLHDDKLEKEMIEHLVREMRANHAPEEQFGRLGL